MTVVPIRLICRILLTILWMLIILVPLVVTWQLRLERINGALMMTAFCVGCVLWGVQVKTIGIPSPKRPLLLASNHFSYLDVFALGSRIPARFITKSDIADWPVLGFIARIGGCIFIDRRRSRTLHNMSELHHTVKQRAVISLFPEGTTNDGTGLLPFRSSFFSIAEDMDVAVQPVSISYTALSGKPIDAANRSIVGWYGDATFFPHVLRFLCERSVNVTLIFHDIVDREMVSSRKAIASYCQNVIAKSLES